MGASHGIGYVLGAAFDVPHGHTSCIMLPAVMRWNRAANARRQALVAAAMGRPGGEAGDVLDAFIGGLGMPRSLAAVGIGREDFPRIAERRMGTPWVPRNPRPIAGPAQVHGDPGAGGVSRFESYARSTRASACGGRTASWRCACTPTTARCAGAWCRTASCPTPSPRWGATATTAW